MGDPRCRVGVPTGCSGAVYLWLRWGAGRILENLKSSPMCYSIESDATTAWQCFVWYIVVWLIQQVCVCRCVDSTDPFRFRKDLPNANQLTLIRKICPLVIEDRTTPARIRYLACIAYDESARGPRVFFNLHVVHSHLSAFTRKDAWFAWFPHESSSSCQLGKPYRCCVATVTALRCYSSCADSERDVPLTCITVWPAGASICPATAGPKGATASCA